MSRRIVLGKVNSSDHGLFVSKSGVDIVDSSGNTLYIPKGKPWISLVPNTFSPSFDN